MTWQTLTQNFPIAQMVKNLPAMQETGFDPWVRKIPWRRKWQPTPVFLPGESHGQRSLAGCSPWGRKESDTTKRLTHAQTVACQAPLPMRFPRQEHWSGLPVPSSGDLHDPGVEPTPSALAGRFFTTEPPGKPIIRAYLDQNHDLRQNAGS